MLLALIALASLTAGTSIQIGGDLYDIGHPVVLPKDADGFDASEKQCAYPREGLVCCKDPYARFGPRPKLGGRTDRASLAKVVDRLVLHHTGGCFSVKECFHAMHDNPGPTKNERGEAIRCPPKSAHFIIDTHGVIYQTLDLVHSAFHAGKFKRASLNETSIGVEIANAADAENKVIVSRASRHPDYLGREKKRVRVNGDDYTAYLFRPEQYVALAALTRALTRLFPGIERKIPRTPSGQPRMEMVVNPLSERGIVGHYHLTPRKWDPGSLDWERLLRSLDELRLPVPVRGHDRLPARDPPRLAWLMDKANQNAERWATGFFPVSPGRLWHSGVHLRAERGTPVRAPAPGVIVAARSGGQRGSSSFVLIRHEVALAGGPLQFFSLLAQLQPFTDRASGPVRWVDSLGETYVGLGRRQVVFPNTAVSAGEVVGHVGTIARGAEHGPEVHFEIFTARELPELRDFFHHVDAGREVAIVRRSAVLGQVDTDGDGQVISAELAKVFGRSDADPPHAHLREMAIRHVHEWSDANSVKSLFEAEELPTRSGLAQQLYDELVEPYVFLTEGTAARIPGLPRDGVVVSYHPLTFLRVLATLMDGAQPRSASRTADRYTSGLPRPWSLSAADFLTAADHLVDEEVLGRPVGAEPVPVAKGTLTWEPELIQQNH